MYVTGELYAQLEEIRAVLSFVVEGSGSLLSLSAVVLDELQAVRNTSSIFIKKYVFTELYALY